MRSVGGDTGGRRRTRCGSPRRLRWMSTTWSRWLRLGIRGRGVRRTRTTRGAQNSLIAVPGSSSRSKADKDPPAWLLVPTDQCTYAADWVADKLRWNLTADTAERDALTHLLRPVRRLQPPTSKFPNQPGSPFGKRVGAGVHYGTLPGSPSGSDCCYGQVGRMGGTYAIQPVALWCVAYQMVICQRADQESAVLEF